MSVVVAMIKHLIKTKQTMKVGKELVWLVILGVSIHCTGTTDRQNCHGSQSVSGKLLISPKCRSQERDWGLKIHCILCVL